MRIPFPINIIVNFFIQFLVFAIPISIVYFIYRAKRYGKASLVKPDFIANYLFSLYIFLVLYVTFLIKLPNAVSQMIREGVVNYSTYYHVNLTPFADLPELIAQHGSRGISGILYIIACTFGMSFLYLPLGVGLTLIKNIKPHIALPICAAAPIVIELLQLVVRLSTDIDDVIFALPGALLGVLIGVLIRSAFPAFASGISGKPAA